MLDRYEQIKRRMLECARQDGDIEAVVAIGSSVRGTAEADEFSDLDLIIATRATESWCSGAYPARLGDVRISFVEPTLGGGQERRVIFEDDKDVDMIIFTPGQFRAAILHGTAQWVMNRGYAVLYDTGDYSALLRQHIRPQVPRPVMSAAEFANVVNDFYFHNIWACKKLRRGELWAAKQCVDGYLKNHLLKMIELYCAQRHGVDVWHDGRFLDRWADQDILEELKRCFARYDREETRRALLVTHGLFARLARAAAQALGYPYPQAAEECARRYLRASGMEREESKWTD